MIDINELASVVSSYEAETLNVNTRTDHMSNSSISEGDVGPRAAQALVAKRLDSFRGKTPAQKLQELVDREEIRDLTATYAHRVAQGLANADLFTDDGVFINRGTPGSHPEEVRGRQALDGHHLGRSGPAGTAMPMIHNHLISICGDEAMALCSIELRLSANGTSLIASGYYRDSLRRDAEGWKFAVRDVTFFHWVPLQQGWATPLAKT